MQSRPRQTNCQQEPSYPDHDTVLVSIRDTEFVAHEETERCPIEEIHKIDDCLEFDWGMVYERRDLDQLLNCVSIIEESQAAQKNPLCNPLYSMVGIMDWTCELQAQWAIIKKERGLA